MTEVFMHRKRLITSLALIIALIGNSLLFGQTPPTQPAQSSPGSQASNAPTAQQQPATTPEGALTNQDVIKLSQIGLEPDVIITKINTAQQVAFKLETDDLIALKNAGVNQDVISAMMKRASNPVAVPGGGSGGSAGSVIDTPMGAIQISNPGGSDVLVRLEAKDGTHDLASEAGHMSTTYAFVTMLMFMDYPGTKAQVRTTDNHPTLLVQCSKSPEGRFYLVRCKSNKHTRSVKMGRSGAFLNMKSLGAPDSDWTIPFTFKQVQQGLWQMIPQEALKAGEYGVFGPSDELFDFGVDK
jgi:hypothetical protein